MESRSLRSAGSGDDAEVPCPTDDCSDRDSIVGLNAHVAVQRQVFCYALSDHDLGNEQSTSELECAGLLE